MSPIHTLARLLTTIQRFTDDQTDQLQDLLGFGYNPDDAYDALNQLQALRDLPSGVTERVHQYVKALDTNRERTGYSLHSNDLKLLLRAVGVLKIDAGKIRIGHPTKGVEFTTPAEPGTSFADRMAQQSNEAREQKFGVTVPSTAPLFEGKRVTAEYIPAPGLGKATKAAKERAEEAKDVPLLSETTLAESTEALVWAEQFAARFKKKWAKDPDHLTGVMLSWFASAIEAGRSAGRKQGHEEAKAEIAQKKARIERKARLAKRVATLGPALDMIMDLEDALTELKAEGEDK